MPIIRALPTYILGSCYSHNTTIVNLTTNLGVTLGVHVTVPHLPHVS